MMSGFAALLFVPLILCIVVVAPVWIIAHYVTRWRTAKSLSAEDERTLSELWTTMERMEERIRTIERILEADAPDWRRHSS